MKKINLNEDVNPYEKDIASIERVPQEEPEPEVHKATLLQKLTFVSSLCLCIVIIGLSFCWRSYFKNQQKYALSEEAIAEMNNTATATPADTEDQNVEYVDQVVYNPTKAAEKELKEANDGKDWIGKIKCKYTWEFKTKYDFTRADIGCIWICKNKKTKDVICIRTATYDGKTDTFNDIQLHWTRKGATYLAAD